MFYFVKNSKLKFRKYTFILGSVHCLFDFGLKNRWVLKAPPLISSDLHFSVIKCHCWTYDANIGPKLKKPSLYIIQRNGCTA